MKNTRNNHADYKSNKNERQFHSNDFYHEAFAEEFSAELIDSDRDLPADVSLNSFLLSFIGLAGLTISAIALVIKFLI